MDRSSKSSRWFRFVASLAARTLPRSESRPGSLAPWIVPFAALVAIYGVATLQKDPAAAAESRYLGLLAAAVLAAIAALVSARKTAATVLVWTAFLAAAAAWIAYHGPSRGAVVSLVLTAGLTTAVLRAVVRDPPAPTLAVTVPAAFGFQVLLRGDLLLPPLLDVRTLVSLLVLPAIAGGALGLLARVYGGRRVLVAAAAVLVLAPGWNVTTTCGLVAVAAGAVLGRREAPETAADRALRRGAMVALAAVAVWNPPLGVLLALTGLSLASRGKGLVLVPLAGLGVTLVHTVTSDALASGWDTASERWLGAWILLPAWVLVFAGGERTAGALRRLAHGGIFLAFAAKAGNGPEALAAGLTLVAAALPVRGGGAALQRRFSLAVLFGTAILAAYPWTRATPRSDFLDLLGLAGEGIGAIPGDLVACVLLAALVAALGALVDRLGSVVPAKSAALATAVVAAAASLPLLSSAAPTTVLVDSFRALDLGSERPTWTTVLPESPIEALVLDTQLIHGAELEPGTPVAIVRLRDDDKGPLRHWRIRAGEDTAEWAAARPDVADRPGFRAPPHWLARMAPEGSFFSRLFRVRLVPEAPIEARFLTVQMAPDLPAEVRLVVSRLEIRR